MIPLNMGPVYCEDLSATPGVFPVEPMNTISNGVIILFGLAGLYFVRKRDPRAWDLYLLSMLTVFTGIGSGMWHGFVERHGVSRGGPACLHVCRRREGPRCVQEWEPGPLRL